VNLSVIPDADLISDLEFAAAVMATDSSIEDVVLELENGQTFTYSELLAEAARRAEKA
jgi:hypothetical protein